ncbi:superoxide dismutase [Syncephalis fuscata]|nr:superoxide dismutase [Syncephalis fuscata]
MVASTSRYTRFTAAVCVGLIATLAVQPLDLVSAEKAEAVINGPTVHASFSFETRNNSIVLSGLIDSGFTDNGNYSYHIHKFPVPADGNCTATGGHLDPQNRNGTACTSTTLDHCEMGDLSGKFGKIEVRDNGARAVIPFIFEDPTLTMTGENSIVNRSVVIHAPNSTRIGCANIQLVQASSVKDGLNNSKAGTTSGAASMAITGIGAGALSATALIVTSIASMFM